jgi:hypothetical protein
MLIKVIIAGCGENFDLQERNESMFVVEWIHLAQYKVQPLLSEHCVTFPYCLFRVMGVYLQIYRHHAVCRTVCLSVLIVS